MLLRSSRPALAALLGGRQPPPRSLPPLRPRRPQLMAAPRDGEQPGPRAAPYIRAGLDWGGGSAAGVTLAGQRLCGAGSPSSAAAPHTLPTPHCGSCGARRGVWVGRLLLLTYCPPAVGAGPPFSRTRTWHRGCSQRAAGGRDLAGNHPPPPCLRGPGMGGKGGWGPPPPRGLLPVSGCEQGEG